MSKVPTRAPTHEDIELQRLSSMGLELEEIADGEAVALRGMIELAEDRGRPTSHYLAAIPLATELAVNSGGAPLQIRVCAGTCQRYGALDLLDHLVDKWSGTPAFTIVPVECLDRCDTGPACEINGAHGQLVLAPATKKSLDEAVRELAG
ncbi:MAG TPA: (2Fe-2S) ferredoxin domain-containing protein [Kofleriaceae bacterium]|nr:(2Fe-2S) ferredoxin domain-containing protein [Kofleriaceae bacterium]